MLTFTLAKHFTSGQRGDSMTEQQIGNFLTQEGYTRIPSNLPEFTIYYRMENNYVNVFHVIDCQRNLYITEDQYVHIKDKIKAMFIEKGIKEIHILSLVICQDIYKMRHFYGDDRFCWLIDSVDDKLIIYENQMEDFYGMRGRLEYFLTHLPPERQEEGKKRSRSIPYITAALVLINVFVFLICTFTGNLLYNIGAFDAENFIGNRQYYRIFTSLFLHGDMNHLVSNMLILFYIGEVVEKKFGCIRYSIIFLLAGIGGNLLSMANEYLSGLHISTIGASGAIFGIMGALLLLVIVHKGHLEQITLGRLLFMIFYSLYSGFAGSNINNAAHIGGFICGMAAASILWFAAKGRMRHYRNGDTYEN